MENLTVFAVPWIKTNPVLPCIVRETAVSGRFTFIIFFFVHATCCSRYILFFQMSHLCLFLSTALGCKLETKMNPKI